MKRRDFLKRSVQVGAAIPLMSSGLYARPLSYSFFPRPAGTEDRILVLINFAGGNDGLNTVIPYEDPAYFSARPELALSPNEIHKVSDSLGLHPSLGGVGNLFDDADAAIVTNVGYEDQNRSHFRSTDIWHTASDSDEILFTGWIGRYLESVHPDYPTVLPKAPFALQISTATSLALLGDKGNMGIALENPERFFRLANGLDVDPAPVPDTLAGPELEYIRSIIQQSDNFSREINDAMVGGENFSAYNGDTLGQQMQIVARLINGGLSTSVYIVTLPGFDTHSLQLNSHARLLSYVNDAVTAFLSDLESAGNEDRVVCMTYSEFGRRVNENGSAGTDHGSAAPLMVFGRPVRGGQILGGNPDLQNLDNRGDIQYTVDFRQLYATLLADWFGISAQDVSEVLGGEFNRLPLFSASGVEDRRITGIGGISVSQIAPSPIVSNATIHYSSSTSGRVVVELITLDGRRILSLDAGERGRGEQRVTFDVGRVPSGTYLCRVRVGDRAATRRVIVAH
jgi:uncharacterized protein (DUF1501 family)